MFQQQSKVIKFLRGLQSQPLVGGSKSPVIAVIGDVMLDKYYYGEVKRISPEAPVPVTRVVREQHTLGGAANVAHNLAGMGCRVWLGGMTGADADHDILCRLLDEREINSSGLVKTDRPTIAKLRIIGAHQQMMRIDFEQTVTDDPDAEQQLQAWFDACIRAGINGVVLSDYAKGVCTPTLCQYVIGQCRQWGIPILVDPKGVSWRKYAGADFITPNVKEISEVCGRQIPNEDQVMEMAARSIREEYDIDHVVVTRSEKGLTVVSETEVMHLPTRAREVFDVSGAGDTVAAVLLAATADGLNLADAAQLANLAAGIVVGKVGTYAITGSELLTAVQQWHEGPKLRRKVATRAEAVQIVQAWRVQGERIIFTNGCFDILHSGHIIYLNKAKQLGTRLVIGLNSDGSVRRLKGEQRPIVGETDRAKLLAALEAVDLVVLFDEDTPSELLQELKPDVLVKGGDYSPEQLAGREFAGRVEIIPFEEGYSTSAIIQKILQTYNSRMAGG